MRVRFSGARRALAIGMFAALVAVPGMSGVASAADPKAGPDQLTLQDGTIVSGTFTEFVPQNRVTVLVNGESKTYQWNLLRKATHDGKVVAENQPAALPPQVVVVQPQPNQQVVVVQGQPPGQQAPQGAVSESVLVHMEGDEEAVLEVQDRGDKRSFQPVCHAPCNKMLPLDAMYRITGEGIRESRTFKLVGAAGQAIQLNVNPGHSGGFAGGLVMTIIGPVALLSGAFVYSAGSVGTTSFSTAGFSTRSNEGLQVTGGVLMLAGAALTAVGIPLLVSNARTKVTQEVGNPVRRDAMLRTPTFRDSAHELQMPAFSVVPVFSRAF